MHMEQKDMPKDKLFYSLICAFLFKSSTVTSKPKTLKCQQRVAPRSTPSSCDGFGSAQWSHSCYLFCLIGVMEITSGRSKNMSVIMTTEG